MTGVVAQLQELLGDRFGQEGYLPTSAELGFDMAQSIFEVGVTQRLDRFEAALFDPDAEALLELMQSQAEVFVGLAESLELPGFAAIAQTTQTALIQNPNSVLKIAPIALANYKAAQEKVLSGDRTLGGRPSEALEQFTQPRSDQDDLPNVSLEDLSISLEPEVVVEQTEALVVSDKDPEFEAETAENNWLVRLLKPPACNSDADIEPILSDLVPDRLVLLNLPDETSEATFSEAIAYLKSADFNQECELIPTDLRQADLTLTTNSQDIDRQTASVSSNELALADNLPALEFLSLSGEELSNKDHLSDDWPDIELPTPSFSIFEDTATHLSDEELAETQVPELESQDLEPLNTEIPDAVPIDIKIPDASSKDFELLDVTIEGNLDETEALPDLSLVFNLDSNLKLECSIPTDHKAPLNSLPLPKNSETKSSAPSSKPAASTVSKSQPHQTTLRVGVDRLEQLAQSMGKLLTQQNRQSLYNEQLVSLVKQLAGKIVDQQKQLDRSQRCTPIEQLQTAQSNISNLESTNSSAHFDALELDQYSDTQLLSRTFSEALTQQLESTEAIEHFVRHSSQVLNKQKQLLSGMREVLLEARMLPLNSVLQRLPSTIKRLEAQQNKPAKLVITGGNVLVDKVIVDKLYDPLLHLVRNAFDHGLESTERRSQANKPAIGTITIEALQQGRHLVINVKDDGQGLNPARIRQKAVANQIVTADEAATLTVEQTTDLLFEPGFSTADEISHLSGRGVGLDAVRAQVRSLQGRVTVSHKSQAGTCFTLQIPSSLTIAKLMLCEAANRTYALIADAIEHILIPTAEQVRIWNNSKSITWQANDKEHLIPVSPLSDVLHYAAPTSHYHSAIAPKKPKAIGQKPIVLIRHNDSLLGIEVDRLLGEQELAINALNKTLTPPDYLYGSSILPDGKLTLVLDSVAIAKTAIAQKAPSQNKTNKPQKPSSTEPTEPSWISQHRQKLALTIDDSIAVRSSLSEALKKAGYEVIQAKDGAEGLEQLQNHSDVDVILCDLEMPKMNGFEFLAARQKFPNMATIPVIMLTSRDSQKHRLLAKELGAIAYLTKPFLAPQIANTVATTIRLSDRTITSPAGDFK